MELIRGSSAAILARVRFRVGLAIAIVGLALPGAPGAAAATRPVDIDPAAFEPGVVVVAPGTVVAWTNRDARPRALSGDFSSPSIAPGGEFELRFPHLGVFAYRDRDNPLITGTVIVAAGVGRRQANPPSNGPRFVTHKWRGALRFGVRESWKYLDGKFLSFDGPCNAEVGEGSRTVAFRASFPDVVYRRIGRIEILDGKSKPYRIQRYRETIDAKSSDPSGGESVECGDGSFDPPPVIEQKCDHNYGGRRIRGELSWSPRVAHGRFQWPQSQSSRGLPRERNCGHGLHAGHLVGLNADLLPWDPGVGSNLLYEHGRTSPTTPAETRAIREGRPVTISREFELHWTADCCLEWHEEGKPGTYGRVGARHVAFGRVTIRLTPR
jgi:plastocyanin